MKTQTEALKLALEALKANYLLVNGTETHGGLEQCLDGYYSGCFDTDSINKQTEEAITTIKEALAQPEQEPVAFKCGDATVYIKPPVYGTSPPQRKPLTDEAIATVYWGATGQSLRPQDNVLAHKFARAIEAAHGIKE